MASTEAQKFLLPNLQTELHVDNNASSDIHRKHIEAMGRRIPIA
jgi:hypothetical protein